MPTNKEIINELLTTDKDQISDAYGQPQAHRALEDQISDKAPLKEEDFIEEGQTTSNSIFKTASEEIDIDKDISNYFNNLKNTNIWNESVKSAITNFVDRFLDSNSIIPTTDGNNFNINDIRKANAGKSFSNEPWVRPDNNIDGDSYEGVRGNDAIQSVLKNVKELQFTRTQNQTTAESEEGSKNKYIRLLMPKNTRRVEVEDLDRNFWVIGQTLAGISSFLFDAESPLVGTLQSLLSEVHQLWENVLYLWVDLWAETNLVTKVHSEVVYLPSSDSMTEMKFDNFDEQFDLNNEDIKRRLQYLIDKYPKSNLCIVPIVREDNYYKNYYNNEKYLGIWFYNHNSDTWRRVNTGIKGVNGINNSLYFTNIYDEALKTNLLSINPNDQKIYGLKINESTFKYEYVYPLNSIESGLFIGGIRTIPTLKCEYDLEQEKFVGSLEIIAVDYVGEILSNSDPNYDCRKETLSYSFNIRGASTSRTASFEYYNPEYSSESGSIDIRKGFYLGEIPSTFKKSGQPQVNLELNLRGISLPPLTESILYIYHPSGTNYAENRRKLLKESKSILNSQVTKDMTTPNKITLFTGMYRADIFSSTQASDIQEYYKQGATGEKDVISIGKKQNYNPVYQLSGTSGEKTNLGNSITYETKVGEKTNTVVKNRGNNEYWNRFRDYFKIGCKIYIPDGTSDGINLIDDKYEYWHMFINTLEPDPTSTEIKGKHSLIPLYRTSTVKDIANAGRRGAYWYFYTIYKKQNEEITTEGNWAIKLTEVHMDYAPTLDGGYCPGSWAGEEDKGAYSWSHRPIIVNKTGTSNYIKYEVAGCYYGGEKVSPDPQTGINSISNFYFKAQPRPTDSVEIRKTDPTYTIFRNFAPAYIRGTAGQASTGKYLEKLPKYYFLPIVTMVNTHIWIKDPDDENLKTGNFIQHRIFTDGHYNPAFTTVTKDAYNTLNSYLNNSDIYTVVRRGSNLASLENEDLQCIKDIIKYTGRLSGEFNNTPNNKNPWYWLDFERWPLRGFGPMTKTVNGETFKDWADLTIYQP